MAKPKGGKYAGVIGKLPKFPNVAPERADVIDALRNIILAPPAEGEEILGADERDALINSLQRDFRRLLELEKRTTAGKPWAASFTRAYVEMRDIDNLLKAWDSAVSLLLETYQALMCDQMENEGIKSMKLPSGQPVSTWEEPYATVEDREEYRQWCIKNGLERSMMLPWPTTNAMAKERLILGQEPQDGVKIWSKTKVRLGPE